MKVPSKRFNETNIVEVLTVFPQVEKLYLIVLHYRNKNHTRKDQIDLCMINPINVEDSFSLWYNFDVEEEFAKGYFDGGNINAPEPERISSHQLNMEKLKELRNEQGGVWDLPEIETRTVVAYKTKVELRNAQLGCLAITENFAGENIEDEAAIARGGYEADVLTEWGANYKESIRGA